MKTLIAYYSRTGITKKVAEKLAGALNCEIEEVKDLKNRKGVLGYLLSGREAMQKTLPAVEFAKSPADYDLVIVGTPIWGWDMSSPIRSYLEKNKGQIKKAAFFCTMSGSGDEKAFRNMGEIIKAEPLAVMGLKTIEATKGDIEEKIKDFVNRLI